MRRNRRSPTVESKVRQRHLGQNQNSGEQDQLENEEYQLPALHGTNRHKDYSPGCPLSTWFHALVGRTLLSAAFDFDLDWTLTRTWCIRCSRERSYPNLKPKSTSTAADKSVRPTLTNLIYFAFGCFGRTATRDVTCCPFCMPPTITNPSCITSNPR